MSVVAVVDRGRGHCGSLKITREVNGLLWVRIGWGWCRKIKHRRKRLFAIYLSLTRRGENVGDMLNNLFFHRIGDLVLNMWQRVI